MSGKRRAQSKRGKRSRRQQVERDQYDCSRSTSRGLRWRGWAAFISAVAAISAAIMFFAPKWLSPADADLLSDSEQETISTFAADGSVAIDGLINYCASCHAMPPPDLLPGDRWPRLVEHMNLVITQNNLGPGLSSEQIDAISQWYVERAPSEYPRRGADGFESPIRFEPILFGDPRLVRRPDGGGALVTDVKIIDLNQDGRSDVLISDLGHNALIWATQSADGTWRERRIADIPGPAQTAVADITGNGHLDIVVPDLGTIKPTDDLVGRVVLLVNDGRMNFTPVELRSGLPRTCDAQIADLNGNGRLDILIASFGMYNVGEIGWFEQDEAGMFEYHRIYKRNGASHVRVTDLTGNGLMDFIALVSQEHQEVLAFINQGQGRFEKRVLYKAPHLMWGFSSLELVDLDRDGRLDILLANGDALDIDHEPKPWHGVQWLRNKGNLEFEERTLVNFFGAYRAIAVDITRNGHLDIVVPSMVNVWKQPGRQSMIWLENDGRQNFTPRLLTDSPTSLVTVAAGDLTGNGWPDILAGSLYVSPGRQERAGRVTMFVNHGSTTPGSGFQ